MRNPFRALASANYRRYWLGQSVSLLGTWLIIVALGVFAISYANADDAPGLGLIGLLLNLISDLTYHLVDPRIDFGAQS